MRFEKLYEFKAAGVGILDMLLIGDNLFTCGKDDYIRKWSILNYKLLSEVKAHDKDVRGMVKTPQGILSYSDDGGIKEFDIDLNLKKEYPSHRGRVNEIVMVDDKRFISASDDATVRLYSYRSASFKERDFNIGDAEALCVLGDGVLIGGSRLVVCDFELSGERYYDNDYIYGIDGIYNDGERIFLSRSMEKKVEIRDDKLNLLNLFKTPSWINHIDFYNDHIFMAASNILVVYDKNMNEVTQDDSFDAEINSFFFYNGSLFAAYEDGYVRVLKIV